LHVVKTSPLIFGGCRVSCSSLCFFHLSALSLGLCFPLPRKPPLVPESPTLLVFFECAGSTSFFTPRGSCPPLVPFFGFLSKLEGDSLFLVVRRFPLSFPPAAKPLSSCRDVPHLFPFSGRGRRFRLANQVVQLWDSPVFRPPQTGAANFYPLFGLHARASSACFFLVACALEHRPFPS